MHPMINIATKAARAAGTIIMRAYDDKKLLKVSSKGRYDYVSQIDKAAEDVIIDTILSAYPNHSILTEESGFVDNKNHQVKSNNKFYSNKSNHNTNNNIRNSDNNQYQWIIDPLDGTLNFINGFPHFAISIALKVNNKIEHAVIYDPLRNELFTASRGSGANLDNKKIRVNQIKEIDGSFLGTGFPVRNPEEFKNFLPVFNNLVQKTADIRRAGSAALDLAYVACGRLDGYFENYLHPWDLAAGSLLVLEAGGYVGDYNGGESFLDNGSVIAANMKLYKELLKVINKKDK